jgi:phage shock protein A
MTQEQLQEELSQTKEQLKKALAEIDTLKADITDLEQKINEYDIKRKEYESIIEEQASERDGRTSSQFGWSQAVNFVPVFSHAYSYGTSKMNETAEREQKAMREVLSKIINEKYNEVEELLKKIKNKDCFKKQNEV